MGNTTQTFKDLTLIVVLFLLVAVGLFFVFHAVVYENVRPPAGESRDVFMAAYDQAFYAVMIASAVAVFAWFALATMSRVVHPSDAGKRIVWTVIFLGMTVIAIVLATVLFGRPLDGSWLAYVLLVLPAILAYYIPTVCFSPAPFKYSPAGAAVIRRW